MNPIELTNRIERRRDKKSKKLVRLADNLKWAGRFYYVECMRRRSNFLGNAADVLFWTNKMQELENDPEDHTESISQYRNTFPGRSQFAICRLRNQISISWARVFHLRMMFRVDVHGQNPEDDPDNHLQILEDLFEYEDNRNDCIDEDPPYDHERDCENQLLMQGGDYLTIFNTLQYTGCPYPLID